MATLALAVGALVLVLATLGSVIGSAWGSLALALAFAAMGAFMLGSSSWGPLLGVALLGGALLEAAAARTFWLARREHREPGTAWRVAAALVGIVGSLTVAFLVYALLAFLAWISSLG